MKNVILINYLDQKDTIFFNLNLEVNRLRGVVEDLKKFKAFSEEKVIEFNELKLKYTNLENNFSISQVIKGFEWFEFINFLESYQKIRI